MLVGMITIHSFLSVIIQSAPFFCLLTPIPLLLSFFIPAVSKVKCNTLL